GLMTEAMPLHTIQGRDVPAGTPAYISPEEASGAPPSEAGDWYAVGVTLYEALTGRLPFSGSIHDVLRGKASTSPPSPAEVADAAPEGSPALSLGLVRPR